MTKQELIRFLKNNLKIKLNESGGYVQISIYLDGELITKTESIKL